MRGQVEPPHFGGRSLSPVAFHEIFVHVWPFPDNVVLLSLELALLELLLDMGVFMLDLFILETLVKHLSTESALEQVRVVV